MVMQSLRSVLRVMWRFLIHEFHVLFYWIIPKWNVVANLPCGKVRGEHHRSGVAVFRGIPYAEATRWGAPEAVRRWDGVRDCRRFAPCVPQQINAAASNYYSNIAICIETFLKFFLSRFGHPHHSYQGSEFGSLALNVYTCSDFKSSTKLLPVMVFVHGGAFLIGSGGPPLYCGVPFVRNDCVLVTLNYRMGVLGNLAVPGTTTNRGLRDILAALKWVSRNIKHLGGDPDKVTLFGESAGSMSTANLLSSPQRIYDNKPLFDRAICMSGACQFVMSKEEADAVFHQYKKILEESQGREISLEDLNTLPCEVLQKAQSTLSSNNLKKYRKCESELLMILIPHIDGDVLPKHPLKLIESGIATDVRLMVGTTKHEYSLFIPHLALQMLDLEIGNRIHHWLERFGCANRAKEIENIYNCSDYIKEFNARENHRKYSAVSTDWVFRIPCERMAETHQKANGEVYVYRFDRHLPFNSLGAAHGTDIPYLFHRHYAMPFVGTDHTTDNAADCIQTIWTTFAKEGSPLKKSPGDSWPTYDQATRTIMSICSGNGHSLDLLRDPDPEVFRCWDGIADATHF